MYLKRKMRKSMRNYYANESESQKIEQIKNEISNADAVIIGAGAGLSTSIVIRTRHCLFMTNSVNW